MTRFGLGHKSTQQKEERGKGCGEIVAHKEKNNKQKKSNTKSRNWGKGYLIELGAQ